MSGTSSNKRQMFHHKHKPLPVLNNAPETDSFGFTENEKIALKNLMRLARRHFRQHAFAIYIDFFSTNETQLNSFREVGKFNLQDLNQHPFSVLKTFDTIITKGFDNINFLKSLITNVENIHAINGVQREAIGMMSNAVRAYFLDVLQPVCSPTVAVALEKVGLVIQNRFKDQSQGMGI